jgi:transposase
VAAETAAVSTLRADARPAPSGGLEQARRRPAHVLRGARLEPSSLHPFAADETRDTTLGLLAECFEELGAVPAVVLTDRMGCLKNGVVANVVLPHPEYVRFAAHYEFRPDFCEAADPESKGVVEHLCGYAQRDLAVPADHFGGNLAEANRRAREWGLEVIDGCTVRPKRDPMSGSSRSGP